MGLRAAQRGVLLLGQVPAGVCTGPEAATSPNLLGWAAEQGEAAVGLQHLGAEPSPTAELWGHHPARACSQGLSGWLLERGHRGLLTVEPWQGHESCPGTPQRLRRPRGLRVTKQFRSALPGSRALPAAPGAGREAPRERGKGAGVSRELCPSHTRVCPVLGTPRFARGPWVCTAWLGGAGAVWVPSSQVAGVSLLSPWGGRSQLRCPGCASVREPLPAASLCGAVSPWLPQGRGVPEPTWVPGTRCWLRGSPSSGPGAVPGTVLLGNGGLEGNEPPGYARGTTGHGSAGGTGEAARGCPGASPRRVKHRVGQVHREPPVLSLIHI